KGQEALVRAAAVSIAAMTPRPTVVRYAEISTILQKAIQDALLGRATPKAALEAAAKQVAALK
ncbi:hypothetical protein ABTL46_22125, partial [Acinetobacter baumannii]